MDFDNEMEKMRIKNDSQEKIVCYLCSRCNAEIYINEEYYIYQRCKLCEECFEEIQKDERYECRRIAGDDNDY